LFNLATVTSFDIPFLSEYTKTRAVSDPTKLEKKKKRERERERKKEGPRQTGAKQNRKPLRSVSLADIDNVFADPICLTRSFAHSPTSTSIFRNCLGFFE